MKSGTGQQGYQSHIARSNVLYVLSSPRIAVLTASLSIFRCVTSMPICWNPFWMIRNAASPAPDSSAANSTV